MFSTKKKFHHLATQYTTEAIIFHYLAFFQISVTAAIIPKGEYETVLSAS